MTITKHKNNYFDEYNREIKILLAGIDNKARDLLIKKIILLKKK